MFSHYGVSFTALFSVILLYSILISVLVLDPSLLSEWHIGSLSIGSRSKGLEGS